MSKVELEIIIRVLTFRALRGTALTYMSDLRSAEIYNPTWSLRSLFPVCILKPKGDRALPAVTPRQWNALPLSLLP